MDVKIGEGYDLAELKESAQKIFTATEKDFNEMKDQKWYKRIWGVITFSQRNKKITANNISNLSQAQQLMYKIIVNLSEKNVEVFSIMEDLQDQIFNLTKNNVDFAKKVQLRLYGFKENKSLETFNDNDIKVVVSTILKLSELYNPSSNEQKEYLNNLRYYLGSPEISDDFDIEHLSEYMESIKKQKTLLQIVLEYIYLHDYNFEIAEEVEDFLNNFDIRYQKISNNISTKINAFGSDVLINRFFAEVEEEISEEFLTNLDSETENEQIIFEDMLISDRLVVEKNEEKIIKNKNLIISGIVFIEGVLQFVNCNITLEENINHHIFISNTDSSLIFSKTKLRKAENCSSDIILAKEGTVIRINDCFLANCNQLITNEDLTTSEIQFYNSEFHNCTKLVNIYETDKIDVIECKFKECSCLFLIEDFGKKAKIAACKIVENTGLFLNIGYDCEDQLIEIEDCIFENWKHTDKINRIIDCKRKKEETKCDEDIFDLVTENIEDVYGDLDDPLDTYLISAENIIINKSEFNGIVHYSFPIIESSSLRLENSKFRNCKPVDSDNWYKDIISISNPHGFENSIIKNTDFINTTGISVVNCESANFSVINCRFKNGVISALNVEGRLNLEHSTIENWKFSSKETHESYVGRAFSMIYIHNSWKRYKGTKDSHIKNTNFINCETFNESGGNSIVSMSGDDKEDYWRCKIENCKFIKCNVHKGEIINGAGTKLNFWADSIKNFIQEENCEKIDCIIET